MPQAFDVLPVGENAHRHAQGFDNDLSRLPGSAHAFSPE
jgi:hypothetical protein